MTTTSALEELASYVPALMLRHMVADVSATMRPMVERFPAAVLMADLSGFTALTEHLTRHNPAGAEELTRILDLYFGHLVQVVSSHGGDVVKFAGDGLLALWYGAEPLEALAQRAVQCGLAVQMMMAPDVWGSLEDGAPPPPLKMRVGVGAGEVTTMHLGGVFGRWELLVTGEALRQTSRAEALAGAGEVLVAGAAWPLVAASCMGTLLPAGDVRLDALLDYLPMQPLALPTLIPAMADTLRAYLPKAILARVDAGQTAWLAEQRRVTVLFINLPDLRADTPLRQAQALMRALQSMLYRYEGSISRLGTDGKGPTLVAALGLPPLAHEDDAERGVRAAFAIQSALHDLGFSCAIGVTTGQALCCAVGGQARREYTMMGTIVNRSARLMQAAAAEAERSGRPALLCDAATYQAARARLPFEALPPLLLKGVAEPVPVFQPIAEPSHAPPVVALSSTLVGRERESAALVAALHNLARERRGAVLLIEGEAGIGKSSLVALLRAEAAQAGVVALVGAASPIEKTPYYAWRPIVAALLEGGGNGGTEERGNGGTGPDSRAARQPGRELGNKGTGEPGRAAGEPRTGDREPGNGGTGPDSRAARQPGRELGNKGSGEPGRAAGEPRTGDREPGNGGTEEPENWGTGAWLEAAGQAAGEAAAPAQSLLVALGELAPLAPLLRAVLPLDLADSALTAQMVGQVRADNTRELLVRLLARAARAPTALILEDAQWLDASSWALLLAAAEQVSPLLLVVVARSMVETPPEYQRLAYRPDAQRLQLRGLAPEATRELLARRLGVASVPEALWQLIAERAQGNPFFSEELALSLRDSGAISVEHGVCQVVAGAGDPAEALRTMRLPDTVQALLTSRIDRLDPPQQLTLKVASVIGPVFRLGDLAAIHPVEQNHERLVDQLFALQQAGLVAIEAFEQDLHYAFKPAAASEVAYNLMSFAQRRRLHRALAQRFSSAGATAHDARHYARLAHHWCQAAAPARAMRYLALAGEHALRAGAYREAVGFLSEALTTALSLRSGPPTHGAADEDLAPDELSLAVWERQLGEAYHSMGRLLESREQLARAATRLGHPPPAGPPALLGGLARELLLQVGRRLWPRQLRAGAGSTAQLEAARAYATLSQLAYYDSQILSTLYAALRGLNLAESGGLSPELAEAYASVHVALGLVPPLARVYRRLAQTAAAHLAHLPSLLWVAEARALYALGLGDWRGARAALGYAIAIAEQLGDQRRRTECRGMLCLATSHQGDLRAALAGCLEVEQSGARYGDVQMRTWGLVGAAENLLLLGETSQATTMLGEAEGLLTENLGSARAEEIWTYALMARAALRRDEPALAHALAGAAVALLGQVPQAALYALAGYSAVAEVYLTLWEVCHFRDPGEQRALERAATRICRALDRFALVFPVARPAALLWRGQLAWLRGAPTRARRSWRRAAVLARRRGMPYEEARAHFQLGRHAAGATRRSHLAQASALFGRIGAAYDLAQARALRGG